jgi:8-oxo-dGTP pyrophosphatase MutT (NUDIX family)
MSAMPADREERIRQYLRGAIDVVPPRDAATVVLLRDGASGPEAYLLRRQTTMAFGAGMHVFPGGSVDARDRDGRVGWVGPPPSVWAEAFSCPPDLAAALVCAAVRETFEESGVLLAADADGALVTDTTGEDWETDRLSLVEGTLPFSEFLARRSLLLRADLLRPWAHWITPEWSVRRFDTRFFIAALPAGQQTRDVGGEADRVVWLPVTEALDMYRSGSLTMMIATASNLRDLAPHQDVSSAMAAPRRIRPIEVRPVFGDAGLELVYDDGNGAVPTSALVAPLADGARAKR